MSAFSFINESRLPDNQTSNTDALVENSSKRKQKRAAYQQSGQASNSLFIFRDAHDDPFSDHSSHNSAASSSNREENVWNKNFKSSFSFINQGDSTKLTSPVAKHQPLKFSSSFIMEDFMDIDEDRVSVKFDKSMKENVSKYFSFLEEYSSASSGKRRDESRKGKGKTTQSMLDYSVPSDQADGQALLIKSAFNFINQAPLTTDTSNATSPSLLGEENVHAMSKSIIKPDKETTLLQASTRWQKIQKKKSTQVQRIKKQYEDQIKYQKMVHEMKNEISAIAHEKQQALDSENYEAAHKYAVQGEKMEKDYADLLSRNFQDRIRKEWEQLICILQQESQDAETMARCCQEVKDERRRRFETFAADKERSHKEIVKQMEQQRAAIESEKSEIAFDLDMWSQNHTDLDERMEEAVQAEVKRKKSLEATSATIQTN
ncbi:hypothetical protein FB192DRAFT_1121525 [Mucor lusitanicus]|uniref:Uncharacterized protein n=1 Tax=Mucor circinelloides f. lusitanicus TaxID=29924 RepID=A0A8H4F0R6_MUCCL|nr:hypothetical protein FB192DRAFT_1121525 [Mucor lusitanicus]